MSQSISRRSFLKCAGSGAVSLAAALLFRNDRRERDWDMTAFLLCTIQYYPLTIKDSARSVKGQWKTVTLSYS